MNKRLAILILALTLATPCLVYGMEIVEQFPTFSSKMVLIDDPLTVVFDQSLDTTSVTEYSFFVKTLHGGVTIPGVISFATTIQANDTVVFTPTDPWPWAVRLELHVTGDVVSATGDPFSGVRPDDGLFVANIPNDFEVPIYDPQDPFAMFVDSTVLMGYNPIDPEAPTEPWEIPGLNVTGAWKYGTGDPTVLVAIIDDGISDYGDPEMRRSFFLNKDELPLPNVDGTPCADYDCNGDGRFDVDDYAHDNRLSVPGPVTADDLIQAFSDGVDGPPANGLVDDIAGWDFARNTNQVFGVEEFPEGTHGNGEMELVISEANNGIGDTPGICPNCMAMLLRASSVLIYDYNNVAAAARYAQSMGASVINLAGVNFNWSRAAHQAIVDATENGALTVAASGDEMTFHHWMPAAGEDVVSVKTIFPMVPVELLGPLNLGLFGFTETYCTNYGTHTHVSVPAQTACTSDSTGSTTGMVALIMSYAHQRGIDLAADEAKQLLTMTADDVKSHCASIVNLLGVCQEGFDMHFGYGRPNLEAALLALGDPDRGIDPAIPPTVRITSPEWWSTFDPTQTLNLEVAGEVSSRTTPYQWRLQIARGNEPKENQFDTVASGDETGPLSGPIATIPLDTLFPPEFAEGVPQNQYTFEVTIRLQAYYETAKGTVLGEARKSISVHSDNDPATGVVPGFPLDIGASGESSPLLYDLDGDPDQRLEVLLGTGDGRIVALKYSEAKGGWADMPGFPVSIVGDDPWLSDSIFASLAVGDIFGDGMPEIVAATMHGKVYVIDPATGDVLDGFPVSADPRDNSTPLSYAYGNSFISSPVLADLDRDGVLEIIAASVDQNVYAWEPDVVSGGEARRLAGWPVLCRSEAGLVPADKVCEGNGLPAPILGTPAVGILDPTSSDEDISQYPSVVVGTGEACDGLLWSNTRVYAIYHNGTDHNGGAFLPGWPAAPSSPLGDALPLPIFVGSTASPIIAITDEGTRIGIGSMGWFPQLIYYQNGRVTVKDIPIVVALNAVGTPSFSKVMNDDNLQYLVPILGIIKINDLGFNLFNSRVISMNVTDPHDMLFEGQVEDMPLLVTQTVADLNNDGAREVLAGSGGYLIHAFSPTGGEAPGWPKYTQKWTLAAPAVGDIDGDGQLEIVAHTREGVLYAWESEGAACPNDLPNSDWRRYHHDERNTGYYGLDTLPPARVTDLVAERLANGRIRLSFTATGNDWRCGLPVAYELRYSTEEGADLSDPAQFAAATSFGISVTAPGGEATMVIVDTPDAAHFALRASDEAENLSRISNDAAVTQADDDTVDDDSVSDDDVDDDTDDDSVDDDAAPANDDDDDNGCGC